VREHMVGDQIAQKQTCESERARTTGETHLRTLTYDQNHSERKLAKGDVCYNEPYRPGTANLHMFHTSFPQIFRRQSIPFEGMLPHPIQHAATHSPKHFKRVTTHRHAKVIVLHVQFLIKALSHVVNRRVDMLVQFAFIVL
jgi:hypothetical protein